MSVKNKIFANVAIDYCKSSRLDARRASAAVRCDARRCYSLTVPSKNFYLVGGTSCEEEFARGVGGVCGDFAGGAGRTVGDSIGADGAVVAGGFSGALGDFAGAAETSAMIFAVAALLIAQPRS